MVFFLPHLFHGRAKRSMRLDSIRFSLLPMKERVCGVKREDPDLREVEGVYIDGDVLGCDQLGDGEW